MNYAELWKRLTWVLLAVWWLFCIIGVASNSAIGAKDIGFLLVGTALIFGVMRAIAWIASGLFRSDS